MSSNPPTRSSSTIPQKRARPVQSCLRCRNKKLKCDRQHPCAMCAKFNRAEHCIYDERAGSMGQFPEDTTHLQVTRNNETAPTPSMAPIEAPLVNKNGLLLANDPIGDLQKRVHKLEELVRQAGSLRGPELESHTTVPTYQYSTVDPIEGTKRRYYGLSDTRSLIALENRERHEKLRFQVVCSSTHTFKATHIPSAQKHLIMRNQMLTGQFPDAVIFVNKILGDPEMQTDFNSLQRMFPKDKVLPEHFSGVDVEFVIASIPPRDICDQFVQFYTRNFESIYRILHMPTFFREYERFWHSEEQPGSSSGVEFKLQLAIVAVIGSGLRQLNPSTTTLSTANLNAHSICTKIDAWISGLKGKQRMQLSTFQTSCLLVLAKQMLSGPTSEIWRCTGDLIRSALAMRLHRDPDEISDSKIPTFQAEIRRRLWYTVAEMDVQASISCCMPTLVQVVDYSCRCPAAIYDDDLTSEMTEVPKRAQNFDQTSTFSQIPLAMSLPVRLRALRLLNQSQPSPEEIYRTLSDLEAQRASLPQAAQTTGDALEANQILKSIMLDMCYRRPLMSLYTLSLQNTDYLSIHGDRETAKRCIELCMGIMSHSGTLDPDLSDYESVSDGKYWERFQTVNGDDVIRAAYVACLCMEMTASKTLNPESPVPPHTRSNIALDWPKLPVRRMIEDIIGSFVKRKPDLRSILKQLMGLPLALEVTRQTGNEARRESLMRAGLQRVLQQCRERYAADGNKELNLNDDSDSFLSQPTPDVFGDFMLQDFDMNPLDLDWNFDSLPGFNSQLPFNDHLNLPA